MKEAHSIGKVTIRGQTMRITIDGRAYSVNLAEHSRKLASASVREKRRFEVSPSGYGIHWPDLDEDLAIDGLIGVRHAKPLAKVER